MCDAQDWERHTCVVVFLVDRDDLWPRCEVHVVVGPFEALLPKESLSTLLADHDVNGCVREATRAWGKGGVFWLKSGAR